MKPINLIFPALSDTRFQGKCPTCGTETTRFRNKVSLKEYRISGMCQECQDSVFGVD